MATGHRPGKKLNEPAVLDGMDRVLSGFPADTIVITGGADGADRLWARAAYRRGLTYHLYVPHGYSQHYKLGEWSKNLLWSAEEIVWTQPIDVPFEIKYNFVRNTQMVEAADKHLIVSYKEPQLLVKTTKSGGTRHCAAEILKRDLPYIWIDSLTGEVTS